MRHHKSGRKFNRNTSHRRAMFRNLAANLVLHERIETTDAKARELRGVAERLITRALRLGDELTMDLSSLGEAEKSAAVARRLHAQRQVGSFLPKVRDAKGNEINLVHKIFTEIAPRFLARVKENKGGGYTRIIKLNERRGDNAPMAIIEILPAN